MDNSIKKGCNKQPFILTNHFQEMVSCIWAWQLINSFTLILWPMSLICSAYLFSCSVTEKVGYSCIINISVLQKYRETETSTRPGDMLLHARFIYPFRQNFVCSICSWQNKHRFKCSCFFLLSCKNCFGNWMQGQCDRLTSFRLD